MHNIDIGFFDTPHNELIPSQGCLLVANPFLSEKWFDRSVIYVIEHDESEGTIGVVLNLAIENPLQELAEGIFCDEKVTVFCGGPLSQDSLYFIHTLGPGVIPGARSISNGLWIGGDFEAAAEYVNSDYPREGFIRFFVGYSGWSGGQLSEEIESGTWAVAEPLAAPVELLKGYGEAYWHREVRNLGPRFRSWLMVPHDTHKN